jgi:hypothetical protein
MNLASDVQILGFSSSYQNVCGYGIVLFTILSVCASKIKFKASLHFEEGVSDRKKSPVIYVAVHTRVFIQRLKS